MSASLPTDDSARPERDGPRRRSGLRRFLPFLGGPDAPAVRPARLVLGLGNPGPDYEGTRHNVGFRVIDRLAEATGIAVEAEAARALVGEGVWRGHPVALAKPLTFMNRSGQAVLALLKRYGLEPADVLVVYDDLALPVGAIRLRGKGGAGGHNGVQDLIHRLNSMEFPRLRVGVGDSFPHGGQVQYVLSPFEEEERPAVEEAVAAAAEAALTFIREGLTAAMNQHNRRG